MIKTANQLAFDESDARSQAWSKILSAALALPGARLDRVTFLRNELKPYCTTEQVEIAIETRPALAGISLDLTDKLADSCIRAHKKRASAISFATGLPGGWWMAATFPVDLVQYFREAIVLAQKLAYLYGWPDLMEEGEPDEETKMRLTMLMGVMMGAEGANMVLREVAAQFGDQVRRRLPRHALTKTTWYPLLKQIGKWIGVSITKQSFARGLSKLIPILGGFISAGVTWWMLDKMAKRLRGHLRKLRYAVDEDNFQVSAPNGPT